MIVGSVTKEKAGKTALSGPLTNIMLAIGCVLVATITQDMFWIVAFINAILAVFNLIPFGIMDGLKVFNWNKIAWALAFLPAVVLTIYTYSPALSFF